MRKRVILEGALVVAIAAFGLIRMRQESDGALPPIMNATGEATQDGLISKRRTIDYENVVRSALDKRTSLIALTLKGDVIRDQRIEHSIKYTPLPASTALVRVKYHVEYAFGFPLGSNDYSVSRQGDRLLVSVRRPRLVAQPSVRLLLYDVLESGILVDEKTAIIELQQRIQPEAVRRGRELATRPSVVAASERALRSFLTNILEKASGTDANLPPPIEIRFR